MTFSAAWTWMALLGFALVGNKCLDTPEPQVSSSSYEEQYRLDMDQIRAYVEANQLVGFYTPDSVFIAFEEEGVGTETPTLTSTVEVIYAGQLLDGSEFDSSRGSAVSFALSGLIYGWQLALPYFKREAQGTIVIPSRHGYGTRGAGRDIPPNAVLVFQMTLVDFQ
jgi:FKBP-type peptidyl-prolyl cis-trans isomerase